MANRLAWDDRALINRLSTFDAQFDRALFVLSRVYATKATAYSRRNAPWTDRTGNARNGLSARAEKQGNIHRVTVFHGMPYGVWLETRFSGRFAIIRPTVDTLGPQFLADASKLFGKISGGREV